MAQARPTFHPVSGQRIKYNDSPRFDTYGSEITYGEDRSDPSQWDQATGLRAGQTATVSVDEAGASRPAAPAPGLVRVTTVGYDDYAQPPVLTFPVGRSISSLRADNEVRRQLNVNGDMVAQVNNLTREEMFVPSAGDVVTFKERNKRRGQ